MDRITLDKISQPIIKPEQKVRINSVIGKNDKVPKFLSN